MKVLILPKNTNKELVKYLRTIYIRDEFFNFAHRLGVVLRTPLVSNQEGTVSLFTLVNRVYLYNVYKYIDNSDLARFVHHINSATFGLDMIVNPRDVYEYVSKFTSPNVPDIDRAEIENFVTKELYLFMANLYSKDVQTMNTVLLDVLEKMQQFIPSKQIRVMRIELSGDLTPVVFYLKGS